MRLFIAICLDEKIKRGIFEIQKSLRIDSLKPKWVDPEKAHITLKFLGEIEKEKIKQIIDALKEIPKPKPFIVSLGNIGAFPKKDYPRVIWIGIEKGCDSLSLIANSVETSLEKIGFPKEERPFSAHLTLARIKNPQKTNLLSPYLSKRFIIDEMGVKEIMLIESKLTPNGPIYTTLQAFPL
ncbi:MAG: RNA 2',3'-cyclic phosphodiesterase [bacterium]